MRFNLLIFAVLLSALNYDAVAGGKEDELLVSASTTGLDLSTHNSRQTAPSNPNTTRPTPQASPFPPGFEEVHSRVERPSVNLRDSLRSGQSSTLSSRTRNQETGPFRYNDLELSHREVMKRAPKVWAIIFDFSKRNEEELQQQGWQIVKNELYEPVDELQKELNDLELKQYIADVLGDVEQHYRSIRYREPNREVVTTNPIESIPGIASIIFGYLGNSIESMLVLLTQPLWAVRRVERMVSSSERDNSEMEFVISMHLNQMQRWKVMQARDLLSELNRREAVWRHLSTKQRYNEEVLSFASQGIGRIGEVFGDREFCSQVAQQLGRICLPRYGSVVRSWKEIRRMEDKIDRTLAVARKLQVYLGAGELQDVDEMLYRTGEMLSSGLVDNSLLVSFLQTNDTGTLKLQHRMDYLLLSLAAENGWSGLVRLLVEAGAILYEKGTRQSPLAHAVAYGDATALKFLIAKRSPLEGALYRCKDPTLAELLVKAGADMNQDNHPDYNGMTPLEVAVRDENYPMIQFYLNNLKGEENRARQILKARREAYYLQPGPSQDKIMQVLDESFFAWYDTCDMARRSKIMNKIPF